MAVFRNVVFIAALSGLLAGLVLAGLQSWFTVPLILQAEAYEHSAGATAHDHHHDSAWAPADGAERLGFTIAANVVTGIGFALLLVAVSEVAGGIGGWRQGLGWGLAGFAVFTLAPGLGLPPELPGMPAADLAARQTWWVLTAAATAGGLAMIVFGRTMLLAVCGIALILAPHLWGAPLPDQFESEVPADLHHRFVVAVTLTNFVFWLVLGAATGMIRSRMQVAGAAAPKTNLA